MQLPNAICRLRPGPRKSSLYSPAPILAAVCRYRGKSLPWVAEPVHANPPMIPPSLRLSVRHRPGLRDRVAHARSGVSRDGLGRFGLRLAALAALLWVPVLFPSAVQAAERVQVPVEISAETAARFGRLWVQTPQGRIQPVNTYSSELLRKIYHRDRYGQLDGDRMLLQWLCYPAFWSDAPLIYLADKTLRERFGARGKQAAYNRFFDARGRYRLASEIEAAYALPPGQRSKSDKELIKTDEKINILHALFSGRMLALFPADSGAHWYSPGDAMPQLTERDSLLVTRLFSGFLEALRQGRSAEADSLLGRIERFQQAQTAGLHLSEHRKRAELFYNRADFFRTAFRGYLLLGLAFVLGFALTRPGTRRRRTLTALTLAVLAVFLWQSAGMGCRWYISGRAPWTNAYESMVYVGWTTVLAGLVFARRSPLTLTLATLMGGVVLFVSNLNWLDPQITPLVPVLRSPWLMIHVSVITASYGFFGICALCGLGILVGLSAGRPNRELRIVGELSMIIGLVLLTAGIFFGAVWANESWGRYWGWDPKETWALITMLFYAFVLHARFLPALNNDFAFGALSVGGIYTVLMTFFGVNYLLSGLHSYGHSEGISLGLLLLVTALIAALVLAAGLRFRQASRTSRRQ